MVDPERIFVHVPYSLLAQYRDLILKSRLAVEVLVEAPYLEVSTLEALAADLRSIKDAAGRLAIHAPYEGLHPAHTDESVREETLRLLTLTCGLAQAVGSAYVVAHSGYESDLVKTDPDGWLKRCFQTWKVLLGQPASLGVSLALEHTYEPAPHLVRRLIEHLPAHRVGVCLDTGHLNCFASSPPSEWWTTLGDRILVLHLHDNSGQDDEHLGIGEGTFDFPAFFRWLKRANITPYATIEGRDPQAVFTSLAALGYPVDTGLLGL